MPPFHVLRAKAVRALARFRADESGTTAIEYALIASTVSVAIAGVVWNMGGQLKTLFYDKIRVTP